MIGAQGKNQTAAADTPEITMGWVRARSLLGNSTVLSYLATIGFIVLAMALFPAFRSTRQLLTVVSLASFLGIAASGQTIVVISGGIDLSVAGLITLGDIMTVLLTAGANSRLWLCIVVLLVAAGIGAISGLGIAVFRISPLIMTLGIGTVVQGFILVVTQGTPVGVPAPILVKVIAANPLGIPAMIWFWLAVSIIVVVLLNKTALGREIYAWGSNSLASQFSGVNSIALVVKTYALSAVLSAFVGVLLAGYSAGGFLDIGDPYLLPSVAAVVVGGTSILGGKGGYVGTIAGAIFMTMLSSVLQIMHIADAGREIASGLAIICLLLIYGRQRSVR